MCAATAECTKTKEQFKDDMTKIKEWLAQNYGDKTATETTDKIAQIFKHPCWNAFCEIVDKDFQGVITNLLVLAGGYGFIASRSYLDAYSPVKTNPYDPRKDGGLLNPVGSRDSYIKYLIWTWGNPPYEPVYRTMEKVYFKK
jgi:hypothetical protein